MGGFCYTKKMNGSVKKLINLKSIINDLDKADILLVWGKFKPATMIELSYFKTSGFSKKIFHKNIESLEKILRDLKLEYKIRLNYPKSRNELTKYSLITPNKETLKKLIITEIEKNDRKKRMHFGILLGYPKTAVKAFADNRSIKTIDLPITTRRKLELKFLNFRLSKNWRKEIIYLQKKVKAIHSVSPELYQKIIK